MVLCLAIQGCQQGSPLPDTRSNANHAQVQTRPAREDCTTTAPPGVEHWLAERERLCRLSPDAQKSEFKRLDGNGDAATRHARMAKMILASCQPALTPGLLRQSLGEASRIADLSAAERRLIDLIRAFDESNRILETRNQHLKSELEKTVDGIREIETDIGDMNQRQVVP
ncbi:MAG: hypothetical protein ACOY42_07325 [Pseudomonadota bacterium]|jgi:hypothetical protein